MVRSLILLSLFSCQGGSDHRRQNSHTQEQQTAEQPSDALMAEPAGSSASSKENQEIFERIAPEKIGAREDLLMKSGNQPAPGIPTSTTATAKETPFVVTSEYVQKSLENAQANSKSGSVTGTGIKLADAPEVTWYLRNSNQAGPPDVTDPFTYGWSGATVIVGDWDGDGKDTIGVYDAENANWWLRNSNKSGGPDIPKYQYGGKYWWPVRGKWGSPNVDGTGGFHPSLAMWYIRKSPTPGVPEIPPFQYGGAFWIPVVGDWDGDGLDGIGVFDPATASWYLRQTPSPGKPEIAVFAFGSPNSTPVVGDWDGDGKDSVGFFDAQTTTFYLRNSLTAGKADITVPYKLSGFENGGGVPVSGAAPVVGDWNGDGIDSVGIAVHARAPGKGIGCTLQTHNERSASRNMSALMVLLMPLFIALYARFYGRKKL